METPISNTSRTRTNVRTEEAISNHKTQPFLDRLATLIEQDKSKIVELRQNQTVGIQTKATDRTVSAARQFRSPNYDHLKEYEQHRLKKSNKSRSNRQVQHNFLLVGKKADLKLCLFDTPLRH